ncbi:hypothetical protein PVK06_048006 [Gossypium arboreum]|uniref:DUF4283 domain-containing protein n=1 Tax=Gossypium arboreum TaxID=29729 RepID=A0ABR0MES3_GOSAR|nr:hypothetical protein PVK06_048006 [Gossypium arboreum]
METQNFGNDIDRDPYANSDRNTKKVRFKEVFEGEDTNMVVDSDQQSIMSFKDKLLGGGVVSSDENIEGIFGKNESGFELLEGDVNMSMVNGISAIAFSESINDILFKEMELAVILKLLVRNIGYNVLHNRILNLWKPAKPFNLMDTTNGYFLVKFQDIDDYNKFLTQGQWIIFEQYLTMQSWTKRLIQHSSTPA